MRFLPKGGIWKNTEDEILKACVMKYGLNQWSRISSLLTRKSAKQCKARWYEWLDPSIKKTEWSKEEEEKLLHLAKVMPTQWRTIAPIIGRTATQCLEHYEKLISMHEAEEDPNAPDPKRLRPGEIDPAPETRPARPDPVDMDEDELEMLQEARARLANTKGKKAKRKARERMLREARRLSTIQQRNELKAAGIEMQERRTREVIMDYNVEIPFQIRQPIGFYSTVDEDRDNLENKEEFDFKKLTTERFEGNPVKREALERRKDIKKQKLYKELNLPAAVQELNRQNDPKNFISKRPDLDLPAPQVSNEELENIARLYPADENGAFGVNNGISNGETPSMTNQNLMTPSRTPLTGDFRRRDIEDNIALKSAKNPLLGGESVQLNDPDFAKKGVNLENRKNSEAVTPNVLVSSIMQKSGLTPLANSKTPLTPIMSEGKTPLRDSLNINSVTPKTPSILSEQYLDPNFDNKIDQKGLRRKRRRLQKKLNSLPQPKLQKFLQISDSPKTGNADQLESGVFRTKEEKEKLLKFSHDPDMEDFLEDQEQKNKKFDLQNLRRKSQVVQRNLPKPLEIGFDRKFIKMGKFDDNFADQIDKKYLRMAQNLIETNYFKIIENDVENDENFVYDSEEIKYIEKSRKLISDEIEEMRKMAKERFSDLSKVDFQPEKKTIFNPRSNSFVFYDDLTTSKKLVATKAEFSMLAESYKDLKKRNEKTTKNVKILLDGMMRRVAKIFSERKDVQKNINSKEIELETFNRIYKRETFSIPLRREELNKYVDNEIGREKILQKKYEKLFKRYKAVMNK